MMHQTGKRLISTLMAFFMVFALLPLPAQAAESQEIAFARSSFTAESMTGLKRSGVATLEETHNRVTLIPDVSDMVGGLFTEYKVSMGEDSFSMAAEIFLGECEEETPADGFAIIIAKRSNECVAYQEGSSLGYSGMTGESVAVEFFTYSTSYVKVTLDKNGVQSNKNSATTHNNLPVSDKVNSPAYIWVDYDKAAGKLYVYASENSASRSSALEFTDVDLSSYDKFYIGITAASGDSHQEYAVSQWYYDNAYHADGLKLDGSVTYTGNYPQIGGYNFYVYGQYYVYDAYPEGATYDSIDWSEKYDSSVSPISGEYEHANIYVFGDCDLYIDQLDLGTGSVICNDESGYLMLYGANESSYLKADSIINDGYSADIYIKNLDVTVNTLYVSEGLDISEESNVTANTVTTIENCCGVNIYDNSTLTAETISAAADDYSGEYWICVYDEGALIADEIITTYMLYATENAVVTVNGNLTLKGDYYAGIQVCKNATVTVGGDMNVILIGEPDEEYDYYPRGFVWLFPGYDGEYGSSMPTMSVAGDVTLNGADVYVWLEDNANLTVDGNLTLEDGTYRCNIEMYNNAVLTVNRDVTLNETNSYVWMDGHYRSDSEAWMDKGVTLTVSGNLTLAENVVLDGKAVLDVHGTVSAEEIQLLSLNSVVLNALVSEGIIPGYYDILDEEAWELESIDTYTRTTLTGLPADTVMNFTTKDGNTQKMVFTARTDSNGKLVAWLLPEGGSISATNTQTYTGQQQIGNGNNIINMSLVSTPPSPPYYYPTLPESGPEPEPEPEPEEPPVETSFYIDVQETDWYYDAVKFMTEYGLIQGTGEEVFSPDTNLTRGMLVTILYRLEKKTEAGGSMEFSDVASDQWYTDAVAWAAELGIIKGYGNGNFGPDDNITREQLAVILYNFAKYKGFDISVEDNLDAFVDGSDTSSWAKAAMQWAVKNGLIQGKGSGVLDPTGFATRAEVSMVFMRFIQNFVTENV